ncbi:KH domain-containing protein SPIN1 isoform X1 [Selaginella moellendorffii]|uniref:KH domain-containing protein SPIN1 isoform X1 n=1 Tax=Selaginella moellendorffii TaxID=88036 RepID=UPI000D1C84F4|nr:KH domain-containing protein SPIN1 isoform X1 [Selaginella moellendorffii]|eukprot:XP_002974032.2 KH domain-containing protein SPIN1 isoform X1 [Selaginella moellendorffii]
MDAMSGHYMQFSPSAIAAAAAAAASSSPHRGGGVGGSLRDRPSSSQSPVSEHEKYFAELLEEQRKLGPFSQVLPICSRLLNEEILRITEFARRWPQIEQELDRGSPLSSMSNGGGWSDVSTCKLGGFLMIMCSDLQRLGFVQTPSSSSVWHGSPESSAGPTLKKTIRIEVPVDKYPNFNFVGRILGPRGNSLKRVESMTRCRVYIRGRGSIKDVAKEEKMRDKQGYEHLNEPLHLLVEAELPANVIDFYLTKAKEILEDLLRPVDETVDLVKKAQLRELALLNGTLREESPSHMSGSVSPFSNAGLKRAKTRK